ncbi:hypothetical protein ACIRJM_32405 [Streptomyces sp. NPDC102405]|uniref:hypothetical protein n=1 Tax=Streptomyces sp. NPDC102405 TaxID=3366170 RepID=UPI00381B9720
MLYAGITGRSPSEVSLSGQATLAQLAADPHARSVGGRRVHALPGQPARRSDPSRTALASAGLGVVPGMAAASAATLRLVVLVVGNSETVPVTFVTTELLPQEPEIPAFSAGPGRAPRPASSRP